MTGPRIVISGPTAAGKTTHAKLLARRLGVEYVSASAIFRRVTAEVTGIESTWGARWSPEIDGARTTRDIDRRVNDIVLERYNSMSDGVFDAAFLPWLIPAGSALCVWLDSDLPSRVMKCYVSHLDNSRIDQNEARRVIEEKDSTSTRVLSALTRATYEVCDRFDLVMSNSSLMKEATVESAVLGVGVFAPIFEKAVGEMIQDSTGARLLQDDVDSYIVSRRPICRQ